MSNFYDQLANDDYVVSQAQFRHEMQQIKTGLDRDLASSTNLQDSSGLVNPLGLREASLFNQKVGTGEGQPPDFGKRNHVNLADDDYNLPEPSSRLPRDSADLTLDMLQGQNLTPAQRFLAAANKGAQNMPRNQSQPANGHRPTAVTPSDYADGFSIEQFRQNNAQLQEIMMQLRVPGQLPGQVAKQQPSVGYRSHQGTDDKLKQIQSAKTGLTGSNPSFKHLQNERHGEVSQFTYMMNSGDEVELPGSSMPVLQKGSFAPADSNFASVTMPQRSGLHQQGSNPGGMQRQSSRSTSPLDQMGNYRQAFKPNSAFQAAGQTIVDSKENQNVLNIGRQLSGSLKLGTNGQVSQVELLSQLQQSSSHSSTLQQSSLTNQMMYGTQGRNPQPAMYREQMSSQGSQPNLAGEFTLQPRQPERSNSQMGKSQLSQQQPAETKVQEQHKHIMLQFDDIPISKIQKMPGYQTGSGATATQQETLSEKPQTSLQGGSLEEDEALNQPLAERAQNFKWSIRLQAYREINNVFYADFAQYQASKGGDAGPNGDVELMGSFEQYGPLLDRMITDANSVAAFEGLQVMHTFVKFAPDIKAVTFASHNYLLEKAPTHKPNFRDVCLKILLVMLERGQASYLFPELVKRMKSNQQKIASFASLVVNEAFKQQSACDEINLKNVFKIIQENLSQKNKELRDFATQILQHVYVRCGDDMATYLANCKNLRPVQVKELKDVFAKLEKSTKPAHQVKLFETGHVENELTSETSANARESKEPDAGHRHAQAAASAFEAPSRDANNTGGGLTGATEAIDLLQLIPDNFSEIPYLARINVKKKSMESFNAELARLLSLSRRAGALQIKSRDYTTIFNTVAHMLEDKNMLVFLEGIKTVELLAILIGPHGFLKQAKVKVWIGLLASKYGETKTAVISAVDKAMLAIVNHAYNQVQFAAECVNTIASTHKNPRVKQFVLEHTMVPFIESISSEKELIGNIFRAVKEKLVLLIQKDTSAACRDAAVTLLVTFKQIVPENALVEQAVTALPKYRISEIQKRLNPDQADLPQEVPSRDLNTNEKGQPETSLKRHTTEIMMTEADDRGEESSGEKLEKPKFSKSLTQRIKSAKQQALNSDTNQNNSVQSAQNGFVSEILQGKHLAQETKVPLSEILYDLGTMRANQFDEIYDVSSMEQRWDHCLRQMGQMGLREAKTILIAAVHSVVTTPKIRLFENQQRLKSMLNLMKRLLVLERSIQRDDDGKSHELQMYLKVALLQNVWIANNQGETCQMLQVAMIATNNVFEFTEQLRDVVELPVIMQCPAALQIIEAVYVWLGIRLTDFAAAGMQITDLEMLRGFGIRYLDGAGLNEPQRQALISIMIKFKDLVQHRRSEIERAQLSSQDKRRQPDQHIEDVDKELASVSQMSRLQTPYSESEEADAQLKSSQLTHPQTAAFATESLMQESVAVSQRGQAPSGEVGTTSEHELSVDTVCKLIDSEFEKGCLMIKDMAQKQTLDFGAKEKFVEKLLSIVSQGKTQQNAQLQYKQAYALKALMWIKEGTLGIEDCFKLTQKIMALYAQSEVEETDSSVELYLLNFWTKDLSVRDLTDRIGLCVLNSSGSPDEQAYQTGYSVSLTAQNCSSKQLATFNSLLQWFADHRLFKDGADDEDEEAEDWVVSDLRKIILYLTLAVLDKKLPSSESSRSFIWKCTSKFGLDKVKEFMEIQLMHHNALSLNLLDWLDNEFETRVRPAAVQAHAASDDLHGAALASSNDSDWEQSRSIKLPTTLPVNLDQLHAQTRDVPSIESSLAKPSGQNPGSSRLTPRGMAGAANQSYKERRELYKRKSSVKARESVAAPSESDDAPNKSVNNYSDIITRVEQTSRGLPSGHSLAVSASQIEEASGESDDKDQERRARRSLREETRLEETQPASENALDQPFRTTNTSAYYRSLEKKKRRYTPSAEELADDQDIRGDSSDDEGTVTGKDADEDLDEAKREGDFNRKRQPAAQQEQVREIASQLELSNIKGRHINDKIQMLELEKERIEHQKELLRQQKDEESSEWRSKISQMEKEHSKVMASLANVNEQFSAQLQENEKLKKELLKMQMQHTEMMSRFEQITGPLAFANRASQFEGSSCKGGDGVWRIEKKIAGDRNQAQSPPQVRGSSSALRTSTAKKDMVVSVQKLQRIEDTFAASFAITDGTQEEILEMINKIQRLLLGVEKNVEGELAEPLIIHYTKLKQFDQRIQMLRALSQALDHNEDVLTALSAGVYKALLNYLLWAFAHEKQILESQSISQQNAHTDQNEVTMLSQQLVSKLLNSKRFTTSLVCLFQLLRDAMPGDIAAQLSVEERQYLRVIMRCIQRITRALHSEQPDMVRAFDVLLEMQKMFHKHPPELLREDLPCLADFDFIYRGMKDVSDKLIELQPEKVESFLSYSTGAESELPNAFIKYLVQMLSQQQQA